MTAGSSTFPLNERLRSPRIAAPLRVALVEPEIPPNTGNIARLCAATQCELHLVHPLGFQVDAKSVRRAGLDYWHLVQVFEHESWEHFESKRLSDSRAFFFTGKAAKSFYDVRYEGGDFLIFGKESTGLEPNILRKHEAHCVGIPTLGQVRSLNLANCVALGVYEALRQLGTFSHTERIPLG